MTTCLMPFIFVSNLSNLGKIRTKKEISGGIFLLGFTQTGHSQAILPWVFQGASADMPESSSGFLELSA